MPSPRSSECATNSNVRNFSRYSDRFGATAQTCILNECPPDRSGLPKQSRACTMMVVGTPATLSYSSGPEAVHALAATGPELSSGRNGEPRTGMPFTVTCSFCRWSTLFGT